MIIKSAEVEEQGVEQVARLMCLAARTAPKARGVDNLVTMIVKGSTKQRLAEEMAKIARESGAAYFDRDAKGVERAAAIVLLGQKVKPLGLTACGYCGYPNCAENEKHRGLCAVSIGDLGIALGSAISVAAAHHVDNRIMFTVGRAALNLDLFGEEVKIAYGILLSASGKNPFFDRA